MTKICVAEGKLVGTTAKVEICTPVSVSLFFCSQLSDIKTGRERGCFVGISFNESRLVF